MEREHLSMEPRAVLGLIDRGWRIEKVASFVGHADDQTTFMYVNLGPDEHRAEEKRVGRRQDTEAVTPSPTDTKPVARAAAHLK